MHQIVIPLPTSDTFIKNKKEKNKIKLNYLILNKFPKGISEHYFLFSSGRDQEYLIIHG
jgi:hypothetical protein